MKAKILTVGLAGALVAGGISSAYAAPSAKVEVSGTITAATCEVTAPANINLGVWTPADFVTAGISTIFTGDSGVANSKQDFKATLNNCSGTAADTHTMQMTVSGNTIANHDEIFNDLTTANAGFGLTSKVGTAAAQVVQANTPFDVFTFGATDTIDSANSTNVNFSAYMLSPAASPASAEHKAALEMSVAYN